MQRVLASAHERAAHRRRIAEQIQDEPAVTTIVAQQAEVLLGNETLICVRRLQCRGQHRPEMRRERVVVVHAGDGLHHAAVAPAEAAAIGLLHASYVRAAITRDRNTRIAVDDARHAGGPQQLLAKMAIDELMQIAQVLQQLPRLAECRRHQLDQRFGVIRRDVLVRERGAELARMLALLDVTVERDAQRFLLDALQSALQDARLARVDERREPPLELAIDAGAAHVRIRTTLRTGSGRTACRGT